jgi:hypothetical protein
MKSYESYEEQNVLYELASKVASSRRKLWKVSNSIANFFPLESSNQKSFKSSQNFLTNGPPQFKVAFNHFMGQDLQPQQLHAKIQTNRMGIGWCPSD